MNWWDDFTHFAGGIWNSILGIGGKAGDAFGDIWRLVKKSALGVEYIFTHPVNDVLNAAAATAALLTGNMKAFYNALHRFEGFYTHKHVTPLKQRIDNELAALRARIAYLIAQLYQYINVNMARTKRYAWALVHHERVVRRHEIRLQQAYTQRHVRWALGVVQKEAASAYRIDMPDRVNTITGLADHIITRDPLVRALVGRIVHGILDLAEVDDPILRITLGFVVKEVINRLGIDKAMGGLLDDLLAPILGQPQPRNLHEVIVSVSQRLDKLEGQWAQFMADGGPQVLQAGSEWRDITSLLMDAGLAAFFGLMVADPAGWARETSDVLSPVVGGAIHVVNATMHEWR